MQPNAPTGEMVHDGKWSGTVPKLKANLPDTHLAVVQGYLSFHHRVPWTAVQNERSAHFVRLIVNDDESLAPTDSCSLQYAGRQVWGYVHALYVVVFQQQTHTIAVCSLYERLTTHPLSFVPGLDAPIVGPYNNQPNQLYAVRWSTIDAQVMRAHHCTRICSRCPATDPPRTKRCEHLRNTERCVTDWRCPEHNRADCVLRECQDTEWVMTDLHDIRIRRWVMYSRSNGFVPDTRRNKTARSHS